MTKFMPFLLAASLLLAACGLGVETEGPTPMPTQLPTPIQADQPSPTPKNEGLTLTYGDNAQVELATPAGRHVYIDVYNTDLLTKPPSTDDILLTTHLHSDHYYAAFVEAFPGRQIFDSTGRIELPDVTIVGLAAAHNAGDPFLDKGGTDYIFVIDTGGLRLVHFGDIGQESLTPEQLDAIGSVDVAVMQFANSYSAMSAANLKGFNLMDQVKPRLIIPTHKDDAATKIAVERWTGYYSVSRTISLSSAALPPNESILILGNLAAAYGAIYKLPLWK
jgi:L-ascorbate metabolism protein UlaG (beta-lactamase superfamily)